jgi:unspecific monooxygenase
VNDFPTRSLPAQLPPGPQSLPAFQLLRWLLRPVEFLEECARLYGDAFTLRFAGFPPLVFLSEPGAVQKIFRASPSQLRSGNVSVQILVGEHSLLMLDGPRHVQHRRLMQPTLHGGHTDGYIEIIQAVTHRVMSGWPEGAEFSLHPEMQRITLEVILRTVFGFTDEAEIAWLQDRFTRFLSLMARPLLQFSFLQVDFGRLTPWGRAMQLRREINGKLHGQIAEYRSADISARTDVLARLMAARDEEGQGMSDIELRDEMMTLLVAGHETTAISLTWTFHRLLRHREVYERVRDEIRRCLGSGPLTLEGLRGLAYTTAVIDETLRLNPVFPLVIREVIEPVSFGRYELPAGVFVAPCIYLAHRRSAVWPEPEEFRPERFLGVRPDPNEYFPFGGGSHICIGPSFAIFEMRIVLAEILSRLAVHGTGRPVRIVRRGFTFSPSSGLPIRVERLAG